MIDLDYYAISPEEWAQLEGSAEIDIIDFLCQQKEPGGTLLQSWHVVHFLLTNDNSFDRQACENSVLANVVMGSPDLVLEEWNDPIRYLQPHEVQAVATALTEVPFLVLNEKFNVGVFHNAELYPFGGRVNGWNETKVEAERQLLQEWYPKLVEFFQQAANDGDVIVMSLY